MKTTVLSAIAIVIVGSLAGMSVNAVRRRDSINLERNYFRVATAMAVYQSHSLTLGPTDTPPSDESTTAVASSDEAMSQPADAPAQHPFRPATIDEMANWFQSAEYGTGEIVFIDARKDEEYEEGHIPGAYQIDNYNVDRDFPIVDSILRDARIIAVYCGGGECADSIYLATELETRGILRWNIRLFEGGIKAWKGEQFPLAEGRD